MRTETMGGLEVTIAGGTDREGGGDGPVVVLLHGFGAPGADLVPLWRVLRAPHGTRFVFPAAPLSLEPLGYGDGRAWWMIDLARMQHRTTDAEALARAKEVPSGLAEAREKVCAVLDEIGHTMRPSRLVLGGFSQGAMLSLDVALRTDRALAGLLLMSGALMAEDEWAPRMASRAGLPVLMSHGRSDPLLPFSAAERLREALAHAGLDVRWIPFSGEHTIPGMVIEEAGTFLEKALSRSEP